MIFRVSSLVSIAKGHEDDKVGTANKVNAALFIVFMVGSLGGSSGIRLHTLMITHLPVASEHGAAH